MIFDVKMKGLRRKTKLVAGGHITDVPPKIMYTGFESRENMRITLKMAALNDMSVNTSDIMSTNIKVTCGKNVYKTGSFEIPPGFTSFFKKILHQLIPTKVHFLVIS